MDAAGGERTATLVVGALLILIGLQSVRMGRRRHAWRQRHPGVDPLAVAQAQHANVGSAFGDDSRLARAFRWVLVVVCASVGLLALLTLVVSLVGERPAPLGALLVLAALVMLTGWLGWLSLRRTRHDPREPQTPQR